MVVHTWKLAKSEFGDSVFDEHRGRVWIDSDGDINERQTELATSLRILILTSEHPTWNYITGVVVRDGARCASPGIMPTDDEVREIGAHLESYCVFYTASFRNAMKQFAPHMTSTAPRISGTT